MKKPLIGIITGLPHSFTSLASQLLLSQPDIASGVECGLLLSNIKNFNKIYPFWDELSHKEWGWNLKEEDRAKLLKAKSYEDAYKLLNKYKGGNHKDPYLMSLFKKSNLIFDKTPSYIFKLDNIMSKIDVPFVITLKTFPEGLLGHCRRKGVNLYQLIRYFLIYQKATRNIIIALKKYPDRIFIADYKAFCLKPKESMNLIAKHFGINSTVEFTFENYNKRYGNYIKKFEQSSFYRDKIFYRSFDLELCKSEKLLFNFFMKVVEINIIKIKQLSTKNNFDFSLNKNYEI